MAQLNNFCSLQKQRESMREFYEECCICCETKLRTSSLQDQMRPKQICYLCWYNHISTVVLRMGYRVGDSVLSPFHNAQPIDIITCVNSLKQEHKKQVEETLFRKYNSFTQDIERCPAENCDYVYVGQPCQWRAKDNLYECPKCGVSLITHNKYSLTKAITNFYLLLSNKCPKCSIPIQKIKGCPHMTCPCGHHFCWYCYKDHPSGNNSKRVYTTHTISQCTFIFMSKIVLFIFGVFSILIASKGSQFIDWFSELVLWLLFIIIRALLVDGFILVQVMIYMCLQRNRNTFRSFQRERRDSRNKIILGLIILNLFMMGILHLYDELQMCLTVLFGQILIAAGCFLLGYCIVYSIETWYEYIA